MSIWWNDYQALANKTPLPEKKGEEGFLIFSISILKNFRVFILSKNPEQNCGGFLFIPKKSGRFAAGFLFWVFFIRKSPLITPFSQKFPRASRAGSYLSHFFRALRARVFILFNFPKMTVGFYSFQFRFLKKPVRVFI